MLRRAGLLLFFCIGFSLNAQVDISQDVEYISLCMVDSTDSSEYRFVRAINPNTRKFIDIDPVNGLPYVITGTAITCETFDSNRDRQPNPLYEDCQCQYTINLENQRVTNITEGSVQEYTVSYDEVVRRQCSGEPSPVETYRMGLAKTDTIDSPFIFTGINFFTPGQFVDKLNIRVYTSESISQVFQVDLNPSTVTATYPGLSLNSSDFTFDGSNARAMSLAYQEVINFVASQPSGPVLNEVFDNTSGNTTISLRIDIRNRLGYPYLILPRFDDGDFSLTRSSGVIINEGAQYPSILFSSSNYIEHCELINAGQSGFFITWDRLAPLNLQARINPSISDRTSNFNPTVFCDAPPEVCESLTPTTVNLNGCVSICDTLDVRIPKDTCFVVNEPGIDRLTGDTLFYASNTINSLSFTPIVEAVQVQIGSDTPIDVPRGLTLRWAASNCQLLTESITIFSLNKDASTKAIVNFTK